MKTFIQNGLVRKGWLKAFILIGSVVLISTKGISDSKRAVIWKLNNPELVGGYKTTVLGAPKVVKDQTGTSLFFDGIDDGLILPVNPVAGWKEFTIELLYKPAADGPTAPRFLHFQDSIDNRGTIEARITPEGNWYIDTFLKNGKSNKRVTLIDSTKLHPCDEWYWVALVYDGKKMAHFINGVKELEGAIGLEPMNKGQISLGVRLNKVNWFKGWIKEVRFHPEALERERIGK
ncbi:LamG domain-containing protein [Chitinophagaceae bacterium LB-8]|uniref:LamG domain-containing protein n=1 Tax=Paraflavisolibacter caeni TaxID=2982496 RepID=A0A9X2XZX3_9BACT|nr:LamG-like jellyroll fold domain-containing protein [Paraflavisolibacter caeni]MCU7551997.1 LamG domain-containing protein [Paraflavisolibacter caeni]